jgi:hypothetical protein
MHLETTTVAATSPGIFSTPSPPTCHSAPLSINSAPYSLTQQPTVPCFVNHNFQTYHSPEHSQEVSNIPFSTSDIIVVTNTETLPNYSTAFHNHNHHNYSISLIPMSPKIEAHSPYPQGNPEHMEDIKQEVKLESSEHYALINFPPICSVGKHESNTLHGNSENVPSLSANNANGRQPCLDDITLLPGGTGCVYENNGLLPMSPQVSDDQSHMLPPIGSISKNFHIQNEIDMNLRNMSSPSVSTRRSSAKSTAVRGGTQTLSSSPLGEGVVDLTSLIRCSPTSLMGFSSSSCSQVNNFCIVALPSSLSQNDRV